MVIYQVLSNCNTFRLRHMKTVACTREHNYETRQLQNSMITRFYYFSLRIRLCTYTSILYKVNKLEYLKIENLKN